MSTSTVRVSLVVDTTRWVGAMKATTVTMHRLPHAFWTPERRRRHWTRCGICRPFANPVPLVIDGHAYRRRTKNRTRRRTR